MRCSLNEKIETLFQAFAGKELYPTIQAKGTRLGYGLIKNHCMLHRDTLGHTHRTIGRLLQPSQNLEHSTLARSVLTYESNAIFRINDVTDSFKQWRSAKLYLEILDTYHNECKVSARREKNQVYLRFSTDAEH